MTCHIELVKVSVRDLSDCYNVDLVLNWPGRPLFIIKHEPI